MKILVVGASGRVGSLLVNKLEKSGHEVTGTYNSKKLDIKNSFKLDLHSSVTEIAKLVNGFDVIYFVAGSRGKDLLQTDLNGAVKVMMAAEKVGIKRFIQLSSTYALDQSRWDEGYLKDIPDYNVAKFYSDSWLINNTDLDYTILQPSALTETPATGKADFQLTELSENSISDVAEVLAELIDNNNTIKKVILMGSGSKNIADALAEI
ncbi:NAD(P)H-binding protein [Companilactobacillus baiquanensis]|uniref:NAD(P)H-binding protein n=1 Tax=Companilactobacillus baiquanensis TaxID=2486005 RepID=A0ABW1UWX8_9LACO|nr:NAD(P)H-binding protein [Companilactobacillus baiquanensis]